jgi:hypothetical protein
MPSAQPVQPVASQALIADEQFQVEKARLLGR